MQNSTSSFWRITLDTNPEDCNLNCLMCEEHSAYSDFQRQLFEKTGLKRRVMPNQWISPVLEQAAALGIKEVIPTTMGDPLVSSNFEIIASLVPNFGMKMNVTHNGTFPGKSVLEWSKIIVPITSDIKISWNGAKTSTAEHIMKGLDYQKALINLKEFIGFRDSWYKETGHYCRVSFQLTFMKSNSEEICDIIKLANDLGVDRVKGHHLWVHFAEMQNQSFTLDEKSRMEWNGIIARIETTMQSQHRLDGSKVLLEGFYPLALQKSEVIQDSYECPFLGKELWVAANGDVSPCCAPDELRKTLGYFGNIQTNSLATIINSQQYRHFQYNYKDQELCRKCNMRRPSQA